ncbi:MAG: hypothetical protein JO262_03880 [Solirubrobacterales bacterium]|nr:hypothetical protein [Solirubrobacterales bacterium]
MCTIVYTSRLGGAAGGRVVISGEPPLTVCFTAPSRWMMPKASLYQPGAPALQHALLDQPVAGGYRIEAVRRSWARRSQQ